MMRAENNGHVSSAKETTLTIDNLILGNAHLEVYQSILVHSVAQPNELICQALERRYIHDRSGIAQRMLCLCGVMGQFELSLERCKPGVVENVPIASALVADVFVLCAVWVLAI
jgi:hypothetical protein